jgi:hypothetical protein
MSSIAKLDGTGANIAALQKCGLNIREKRGK